MLALPSPRRSITFAALALGLLAAVACKSSGGGTGGSGGGPVSGPADTHCMGVPSQPISQPDCHVTSLPDAGASDGGGSGGSGAGGGASEYGPTMYNSEADDDDCKYHVKWTSSPIAENRDVTFTVTATYKAAGTPNPPACSGCPVEGAAILAEVYLSDTHPAPNTAQVTTESPAGTYAIGPIQFDAPGKWTVRFHLFEQCADILDDSPHGHAAFYVDVP
jgi:hypothetical protein